MAIVRKSLERIKAEGGGFVDAQAFEALSDDEIERMAADDPDSFDIDEARAVWVRKPDGKRVVIRKLEQAAE